MRLPIRSKLIMAISTLMVVVFSLAAYLFISEKRVEMADDIYGNSLSFARLTSNRVVSDYDLYLAENSFVYFNRELKSIFEQNDDINKIQIVSYGGEILYDSLFDVDKKYEGEKRMIEEANLLAQVRSENVSVKTKNGRTVFIKRDLKGDFYYVDKDEKSVDPLEKGELIEFISVPASEKYSVIYSIDYTNLDERINTMMTRIIYLAIFGIMLGMILSFVMSGQFSNPILKLVASAEQVAKGDFSARVDIKTHDEIGFLGNAFNKMTEDLAASVEARLYKERVTRELELAAQIQKQIVPLNVPKINGLDISCALLPAEEIGGDIYDFLSLGKDRLMMYLGDVTGHGVPAGIVSSIASALFYGYAMQGDLKRIVIEVNRVLKAKTMPNMFMTLCITEWDAVKKSFEYVSAGHEQIIHYQASAKKASLCKAGGVALGMLPDISKHISNESINLQVGDYLVIYSDGIPEAWKNKEENYGIEKFVSLVAKSGQELNSADEMKQAILEDVNRFTAGYKQMDDITLLVVKRTS